MLWGIHSIHVQLCRAVGEWRYHKDAAVEALRVEAQTVEDMQDVLSMHPIGSDNQTHLNAKIENLISANEALHDEMARLEHHTLRRLTRGFLLEWYGLWQRDKPPTVQDSTLDSHLMHSAAEKLMEHKSTIEALELECHEKDKLVRVKEELVAR